MAKATVNYEWDVPSTSPLAHDRGTITVNLDHGRSKGYDDVETARKVIACRRTGSPGDSAFVVIHTFELVPASYGVFINGEQHGIVSEATRDDMIAAGSVAEFVELP